MINNIKIDVEKVIIGHRERLSEETPRTGDAIVCSASNYTKMQKSTEMIDFTKFNFQLGDNKQVAHYMPWITAIRTGIGPFVPCWIAAVVFDESYTDGPRVNKVRNYLLNWENNSIIGKLVVGLYRMHGQAVAQVAKKNPLVKKFFTKVFTSVLKKAEAH